MDPTIFYIATGLIVALVLFVAFAVWSIHQLARGVATAIGDRVDGEEDRK